jgi:hypothetical protein
MQIDRSNYGAFFLDYSENSLDNKAREDLARFLAENPDLQDEFFDFENIGLNPDFRIVFEPKSKLKRLEIIPVAVINQENFEDWIIAYLEGDLSKEEFAVFEEFKNRNSGIENEIMTFKKTYLKPKNEIVYPDKILLKRALKVPFRKKTIRYAAAIAAIFVITFTIFRVLSDFNYNPANQHVKEIVVSEKSQANPLSTGTNKPTDVAGNQEKAILSGSGNPEITEIIPTDHHDVTLHAENMGKSNSCENKRAEFANLNPINPHQQSLQIVIIPRQNFHFADREELSGIFDDMILREAISTGLINEENKKSAFGRVLANLGGKILNSGKSGQQEPALVNSIASRSKETFLEFADGLPIYRSIKKDDQNKTIFAVGENLSIGLSWQNNKNESGKPDNR